MPGFLWAQRPGKWTRFFVHVWQGPQCSSWFSSQFEICEKIQFEQAPFPAPQAEASSRPPESKPDVLIRPKDNKLQLEILSTADHRSMGYKIHSTREILVQMHINAQQISSQVSSNFCVCQFCKAFLHYKLVIWDCLSQNQRLRCPLSPPPPNSFLPLSWQRLVFSSWSVEGDGLFWQGKQVPSQAQRSGVSAVTRGLGWPASRLHFPCVSWYTYHPRTERFQQVQKLSKKADLSTPPFSALPTHSSNPFGTARAY